MSITTSIQITKQSDFESRGINIEKFGAIGDGATNDVAAFNTLKTTYGSTPVTVYLTKSYYIGSNIDLPSTMHFIGSNGSQITTPANVMFNASNIEGVTINTPFNSYYADGTVSNIKIKNTNFTAGAYGILLNNNASGTNMDIVGNNIDSQADPIEINTTAGNFNGIKVIGNQLSASGTSTDHSSGFAVGIAAGKDIVVSSNIIKHSRMEAFHVEDAQERIIFIGNIARECMTDGAWFINKTYGVLSPPIIFTGNQLKSGQPTRTGSGVWNIYDSRGFISGSIITDNIFEGFHTGLWIDGYGGHVNINGNTLINCDIAVTLGVNMTASGTVFAINCDTLASLQDGSVCGKIISQTAPTIIASATGTNGGHLQGFSFPLPNFSLIAGANSITLFKLPNILKGKLNILGAKVHYTADVLWDGTTLTVTNEFSFLLNSVISSVSLTTSSGNLVLTVNSTGALTGGIKVDFDGVYFVKASS